MPAYATQLRPLLDAFGVGALDDAPYVAPAYRNRDDVAIRQAKLADLVSTAIVPRLLELHQDDWAGPVSVEAPTVAEVQELARLVLSPDLAAAAAYVTLLRQRGLSMDTLFIGLLEPAARHLGALWDDDACDFVDVTLGLGRLQKLLAVFNCTHALPALDQRRRVLLATMPGDPHFFGLGIVQKFLCAGGWTVEVAMGEPVEALAAKLETGWFAVAGFTLGSERHLETLRAAIPIVRARSRNPAVGVMVGGGMFTAAPELTKDVGADATAADAPTAVLVAQRLFDLGAKSGWRGSAPA